MRAPVIVRKRCLFRHVADQAAFIERHTRDHTDIQFFADREELVFGILVEDVVDHLHSVDESGAQRLDAILRLPPVNAQAEGVDQFLAFEFVDGIEEFRVARPVIVPDMKLQDIDGVLLQGFSDLLRVLEDVFAGEDFVVGVLRPRWPLIILGRNLGGGIETFTGILLDQLAKKRVALAVSIGPGSVKEVAAQVDGFLQSIHRLLVFGATPATHAPESVADFADFKSSSAQFSISHSCFSPWLNCDYEPARFASLGDSGQHCQLNILATKQGA